MNTVKHVYCGGQSPNGSAQSGYESIRLPKAGSQANPRFCTKKNRSRTASFYAKFSLKPISIRLCRA